MAYSQESPEPVAVSPERPRSVELRPGDRLIDWNDFTKFEVVSTRPDRHQFEVRLPDGTMGGEDGVWITGRDLASGETVYRIAGQSYRWDRVPAELLPAAPEQLSDEPLAAIRGPESAATPGPWCTDGWEIYQGAEYRPGISSWIGEICQGPVEELAQSEANAKFVAGARTDVPVLLAEVDRLRAEREALRERLSQQRTATAYWQGRVAALEALAVAAVEYRVPGPGGTALLVRRQPAGATWAVVAAAASGPMAGRALLPKGWAVSAVLRDDDLFAWPTAEEAIAAARQALGGGEQRG